MPQAARPWASARSINWERVTDHRAGRRRIVGATRQCGALVEAGVLPPASNARQRQSRTGRIPRPFRAAPLPDCRARRARRPPVAGRLASPSTSSLPGDAGRGARRRLPAEAGPPACVGRESTTIRPQSAGIRLDICPGRAYNLSKSARSWVLANCPIEPYRPWLGCMKR